MLKKEIKEFTKYFINIVSFSSLLNRMLENSVLVRADY